MNALILVKEQKEVKKTSENKEVEWIIADGKQTMESES